MLKRVYDVVALALLVAGLDSQAYEHHRIGLGADAADGAYDCQAKLSAGSGVPLRLAQFTQDGGAGGRVSAVAEKVYHLHLRRFIGGLGD